MSKKTFAVAPKPKRLEPETIDRFVQEGIGHDTPVRSPEPPKGPTKRLSLDLPEELHRRFKTACAATGRKMTTELSNFIANRTDEIESEISK